MNSDVCLSCDLLTMGRLFRAVPDSRLRSALGLSLKDYRVVASVENGFEQTAAQLSRRLEIAPSRVSLLVSRLMERGYLKRERGAGKALVLATTPAGTQVFRQARSVLLSVYQELLRPLDQRELADFDVGIMFSALAGTDALEISQSPDRAHLYIRAFSLNERNVTKSAQHVGLTFCGLHTLAAVSQCPPGTSQSQIARKMLMGRSTICETVAALRGKGLLEPAAGRRASESSMRLTDLGRCTLEAAADFSVQRYSSSVRFVGDSEVKRFADVSPKIVDNARQEGISLGGRNSR